MDSKTGNVALFRAATELQLVAVHDESGSIRSDRYFSTGFVFVSASHVADLVSDLRSVRERNDYWGEVHYHAIRGVGSGKFRTARDWAEIVGAAMAAGHVRAQVLAVDTHAQTYDHERFRRRQHWAYNRFTRMALETGIRWCYPEEGALRIRLISDAKSRRPGGDDEAPEGVDDFDRYLPRVAARRIAQEPAWPQVSFAPNRVELKDPGEWHEDCDDACELVQLADLVVSSVAAAIRGPSSKRGKYLLAGTAAGWVRDAQYGNWRAKRKLFRRFGASIFVPGADDSWPKPIALAIEPHQLLDQGKLFE